MKVFEEIRIEAQKAQQEASLERKNAKQDLRTAKATVARAEGRKLPEAPQARLEADSAKLRLLKAEKAHKQAVLALEYAIKEEKDARENNEEELRQNEINETYDLLIGYDFERLGIAYDPSDRSVFINVLEYDEIVGSMHTNSLEDIEAIIASLTAMAKRMH